MTAIHTLKQYKSRRNFSVTPEPAGDREKVLASDSLSFVIQKHWASSLHYDFRLELNGIMKSWAVPKGPSFDPKDKRLAVQVEDHPIAYSSFEGTIPPKQYGAGKVIIWDKGSWHPVGDPLVGYSEGKLKFELHGRKLHGKWALVRIKGKSEKQEPWLLIKEEDQYARASAEFSVVDALTKSVNEPDLPPEARRAALPLTMAPQLASLVDGPPQDPRDWIFEIKFDGYRILTRVDGADVKLFTRNGNDWTSKFRSLHRSIAKLKLPSGWYDGEIVLPDKDGRPDFGALQACIDAGRTDDIVLYLFDLPFFDGHDLRQAPLESRRALLQQTLDTAASQQVRFSDVFDGDPKSLFASACKLGLEGLIGKRRNSPYVLRRSNDWIKLKCLQRQEFVVGGYTDPQGARVGFGSLLLGVYDAKGALQYAGKVGTGFTERTLKGLKTELAGIPLKESPFSTFDRMEGKPHWVKPCIVAEVSFGEWTRDGRLRHPVFHGVRAEKNAGEIVREVAASATKASATRHVEKSASPSPASDPRVTNPERVLDARSGITKIELVRYYQLVGALILPHLAGRPVSLVRAPKGIDGELFFQKHLDTKKLSGIRTLDPQLDTEHAAMIAVAGVDGLLAAAQRNVIEFHTHNALARSFAHPDRMVFDLDPGQGVTWKRIQEAAQLVHAFLTQLGLTSFLKTSGGKGLHVVVPVRRVHDWDTVKGFSQAIVTHLATTIPQRFVAKSGPKNRVGKIFVDYLRNGQGATTVCAWSARARPGFGISVPVCWDELDSLHAGDHWTVRSAATRLDQGNAPWDGYNKAARSLTAAMKMLNYRRHSCHE